MAVCRKYVPGSPNSRVLCTVGVERCVFRVRDGLQPLVAVSSRALDGDVAEPAVLLRAVPVLDPGRDGHNIAGVQGLRGLSRLLIPARPSVHSSSWPPPDFAWWMCQLLRQAGEKVTFARKTVLVGSVSGLRKLTPVKYCA